MMWLVLMENGRIFDVFTTEKRAIQAAKTIKGVVIQLSIYKDFR